MTFTGGLHSFGSANLSNNVTTASGSTSSSQNYTDLSLSHLTSSWNQQQESGGPGGQVAPGTGGGNSTPSISLSTAAAAAAAAQAAASSSNPVGLGGPGGGGVVGGMTQHTIPQLSITSTTSSPPSNSPNVVADGVRVKSEPLSPRDLHVHPGLSNVQQLHPLHHPAQLQRPHSANSALSPHLSPNHIGQGMYSLLIYFFKNFSLFIMKRLPKIKGFQICI